jgi:putative restriction endonuclease
MIAGVGYFSSFSNIPFYRAWELYQHGNGYGDFLEFYSKIKFYRKPYNALEINPNIGCIILNNPIFFNEDDWLPSPPDWLKNTVRGKTYNTDDEIASNLWSQVEGILNRGN